MIRHNLNHDWLFRPDGTDEARPVELPHANVETPFNVFSETHYQTLSTYSRTFEIDPLPGRRYLIEFEGVMSACEVHVNGRSVGSHRGGYTPFRVEITDRLVSGSNRLEVRVDSRERADIPPHGFVVDYLTYGGIYREVWLLEIEQPFITDVRVLSTTDTLHLAIECADESAGDSNPVASAVALEIRTTSTSGSSDAPVVVASREASVSGASTLVEPWPVQLDTWELERPVLYELTVRRADTGRLLWTGRFGHRNAEFRSDGFFLNGRRVQLVGLNRHQSFPFVGYAMPAGPQRRDAEILKYELGCNVVRSSHYPPSRHFLDRCDEIGLLVIEEIPGWQHIGDRDWQDLSVEHVREMIVRDQNHPSIIMWGTRINESADNDEFYARTAAAARELDRSRAIGGVRNFKGSRLLEDVYTYNDFVHRGDNEALESRREVARGDVPYLVTEYNGHMYPTKSIDDEPHRIEHARRHLNVQAAAWADPDVAGAIGWCFADYNTHRDFGSGDRICYHGVLDMGRVPKFAAAAYASQRADEPYLAVLGSMNVGEFPASEITELLVLTNTERVRFFINEELIGTFYPDTAGRWRHLPHPPVIIDDFIGRMIHENEPYNDRDSDFLKRVLLGIMRGGIRSLPLGTKLRMWWFMRRHHLPMDRAAKLYERYVGKWGQAALTFRFEALIGERVVARKVIGASDEHHLRLACDSPAVQAGDTWESVRLVAEHVNAHGVRMTWSTEALTITIDGPLELVGPAVRPLAGGAVAFWVRTTGHSGTAVVGVATQRWPNGPPPLEAEVTIEVTIGDQLKALPGRSESDKLDE